MDFDENPQRFLVLKRGPGTKSRGAGRDQERPGRDQGVTMEAPGRHHGGTREALLAHEDDFGMIMVSSLVYEGHFSKNTHFPNRFQ